jgi:hypothetical protein
VVSRLRFVPPIRPAAEGKPGDDAVVEQHLVRLTRASDGLELVSDVCVVIRFDDAGLITRVDEYADPAPLQALAE